VRQVAAGVGLLLLLAALTAPVHAGWRAETVPGLEEVWVTDAAEFGGSTWLATGNQGVLEWRDGTVIRSFAAPVIPHNEVQSLALFEGKLWAGTLQGVAVWDGSEWVSTSVATAFVGPSMSVKILLENCFLSTDPKGSRLWLEPLSMGGRLMSRQAGGLDWEVFDPALGTILNNITRVFDEGEDLWLGTTASGIYAYRKGERTIYNRGNGLLENQIVGLVREGEVLVAGHRSGISRFEKGQWVGVSDIPGAREITVTALGAVKAGGDWYLLIGSSDGLLVWDRTLDRVTHYDERNGFPESRVVAIRTIGDEVWVGTTRGVGRLRFE
jgi:ligand-binding sensor domain-containing protein